MHHSVPRPTLAAEQGAALSEAQEPEASTSGEEIYETVDFYFRIPRGFQQAVEAVNPRQNLGKPSRPCTHLGTSANTSTASTGLLNLAYGLAGR